VELRASPVPVSGPLTDAELRATAVPVSATQLPAALAGGRLDENLGSWFGSTAPTVGQKVMADSIPVVLPSNQTIQVVSAAPANTLQDIAIGKILAPGAAANRKFAVRRTTYIEPSANAQRSVVSSSASDTAAGVGARTVRITYYPFDLSERKTEMVTLSGTTPVNTSGIDLCFIEKMEVVTDGSADADGLDIGTTNVGTISLFTGINGTGTVIGTIAFSTPGSGNQHGIDGRTYWAHHYVVDGKLCTIQTFDGGTQGNQNAELFLGAVNPSSANYADVQISDSITVGLNASTAPRAVPNTIKVLGPARITLYIIPAGNNTAFFGSFDFYEEL
jgi:hypothetical protein